MTPALGLLGLEALHISGAELVVLALQGGVIRDDRLKAAIGHHPLDGHATDMQGARYLRNGHKLGLLSGGLRFAHRAIIAETCLCCKGLA